MTVTYTSKVATSSVGCYLRLLLRWRGSIYKLVWPDFLIFLLAFYVLSFIYRFALNKDQRRYFEAVARYCEAYNNLIPVAFVLGFYVSIVVTRWWQQFTSIPWPDRMAIFIISNIPGDGDRARLIRRTIMRYLVLSFVITLSSISSQVKKRFPTFKHMTEAGIMLPNEMEVLENVQTPHNKYFVPLVWCTTLVSRAQKEGRIKGEYTCQKLINEINDYRGQLGTLFCYDWISVPLVYTQVVTLSVYTFFLSCLMGRQFLEPKQGYQKYTVDMYVPVFTLLQFLFYMGWLKVAETLVNPFGEDDDDFEVNEMIDRNLQISYLIVDGLHEELPELVKDPHWDEVDIDLPYTAAADKFRITNHFLGSAFDINIPSTEFIQMDAIPEGSPVRNVRHSHANYSEPTDIPSRPSLRRLLSKESKASRSPRSSKLQGHSLKDYMKHSNSQDSHASVAETHGSVLSSTTATPSAQPSPTVAINNPDDIFKMSDLSLMDDIDVEKGHDSPSLGTARLRALYKSKMDRHSSEGVPLTMDTFTGSMSKDLDKLSRPGSQSGLQGIHDKVTPTVNVPPKSESQSHLQDSHDKIVPTTGQPSKLKAQPTSNESSCQQTSNVKKSSVDPKVKDSKDKGQGKGAMPRSVSMGGEPDVHAGKQKQKADNSVPVRTVSERPLL